MDRPWPNTPPGRVVIENGCVRFRADDGSMNVLLLWSNRTNAEVQDDQIWLGLVRVGVDIAFYMLPVEEAEAESLPGMPIEGCPGPYYLIDYIHYSEEGHKPPSPSRTSD